MQRIRHDDPVDEPVTTERVDIPPIEPPSAEEIRRRQALYAEAIRLQELTGPIGISTSELIRMSREDADAPED